MNPQEERFVAHFKSLIAQRTALLDQLERLANDDQDLLSEEKLQELRVDIAISRAQQDEDRKWLDSMIASFEK